MQPRASVLGSLALIGCGPQSYLFPGGPAAGKLASVGWLSLLLFALVTLVTWLLIGALALRKRGTLAEHAPATETGGERWILVGGLLIPAAVFLGLFMVTLRTMASFPLHDGADRPAQLRVIGHQWWFDVQYLSPDPQREFRSPSEIHVSAGQPVDIELISRDVIHSFWVPKLHGKVDLLPGAPNYIRIQADRPGVYHGQCSEFCGAEHANMRIQVVAHTPRDLKAWVEGQRADAASPKSPEASHGQEVFMGAACPMCHTIRGTSSQGLVGPDLTHVASRRRIAGGMLTNDVANLEAWVTHAQSLKPASQMPNLTEFTGRELRDVVTYLQSLK